MAFLPRYTRINPQLLTTQDSSPVTTITCAPDTFQVAALSQDGLVRLFDASSGECILSTSFFQKYMDVDERCKGIQYLEDGHLLLLTDKQVLAFRSPTSWEEQKHKWSA